MREKERERKRASDQLTMCCDDVCVCVCEREREHACVLVDVSLFVSRVGAIVASLLRSAVHGLLACGLQIIMKNTEHILISKM